MDGRAWKSLMNIKERLAHKTYWPSWVGTRGKSNSSRAQHGPHKLAEIWGYLRCRPAHGGNVVLCRTCMWRHAQGCRTQIKLVRGRERYTLTYYISNCGSIITAYKVGIKGHHYYPSILSLKQRRNFVRHKHTWQRSLTLTSKETAPNGTRLLRISHTLSRDLYIHKYTQPHKSLRESLGFMEIVVDWNSLSSARELFWRA
jgi:sarcosine oxidase delta subunit